MEPKEFFPTMPDEVFEDWLTPFIAAKGWPFKSIKDDLQLNDWKYLLGINHTLEQWVNGVWHLENLIHTEIKLLPRSESAISDIIRNCVLGEMTETADIAYTKERFRAIASFVSINGVIPAPLVIEDIGDGTSYIWDGNHRFAAFYFIHFRNPNPPPISAWVVKL